MTGFAGERRTNVNSFRAIKTVYSYLMPEVRSLISELTKEYPHEVFLRSVEPGLDDFHVPIIEELLRFHGDAVPNLADFPCRYPTSGSEEGIREFMTWLQCNGVKNIYMLKGDYEGFREVALTRNIAVTEVGGVDENLRRLEPGYWFISNPSARNGMLLPDGFVWDVCEAGHKVFYDLSYLGTTFPATYDLSHPNVVAAVVSFSKPYGLFYYRIGFTFSRQPIPALYANKWFKNIFGLLIAEGVVKKIDRDGLAEKYKALQKIIIRTIERECGLILRPSDSFLLAHLCEEDVPRPSPAQKELLEKFRRDTNYRFCLTPYFLETERPLKS